MGSSDSQGSAEGSAGEQGSDASDEGSAEASGSPVDDPGAGEPGGAAEGQADGSDADELLDSGASGPSGDSDSTSGSALEIADDQEGTFIAAAAKALRDSGNAAAPEAERVNDSVAPAKADAAGKQPAVKQPTAKRSRQADELDQSKRAKLDSAIPETYDDFQVGLSWAQLHSEQSSMTLALQTLMIHALQDQAQVQTQGKA